MAGQRAAARAMRCWPKRCGRCIFRTIGASFSQDLSPAFELEDRSRDLYGRALPGAEFSASAHACVFQRGENLFGPMQQPGDRRNYQGRSYDYIAFDELIFALHLGGIQLYVSFAQPPGQPGTRGSYARRHQPRRIGHGLDQEQFITPAPPLTPIVEQFCIPHRRWLGNRACAIRIIIPSTVFDNQKVVGTRPAIWPTSRYLPGGVAGVLSGSWDSFDGQVFGEWKNDPAHYADRRYTDVIRPLPSRALAHLPVT